MAREKGLEGPEITIQLSCFPCRFVAMDRSVLTKTRGVDLYCEHGERRLIGNTDKTPDWCPLWRQVLLRHVEGMVR